jgi:pimeloyl-ACP methyl ester carboxylesterase
MAQAHDAEMGITEEKISLAGGELLLLKAGKGRPLLVLHEELGFPGWLWWNRELAREHSLIAPLHPGFGRSPRREWILNVRDLAGFYLWFIREQKLAPVDVIGISFGGWVAAEMAAFAPESLRRIVLVAPLGIAPPQGHLMDMFTVTARGYLRSSVAAAQKTPEFGSLFGGSPSPEQFEAFEEARAEAARLAWQPYMYNPSLPHLLVGARHVPALVIWGQEDTVAPVGCGEIYARALPNSRLTIFESCGHRPEIEQRERFVAEVRSFLAA